MKLEDKNLKIRRQKCTIANLAQYKILKKMFQGFKFTFKETFYVFFHIYYILLECHGITLVTKTKTYISYVGSLHRNSVLSV